MEVAGVDWGVVFNPDIPVLESFVRGTILYFFVFLIMRSTLRRTAGELTTLDFIFVLLVANGAAAAIMGGSISIANGIVIILTIVGWNYTLTPLSWYVPALQHLTAPPPLPVTRDGQMLRRNMRREFLTKDELMAQLREQGIVDISRVKAAHIEGDGNVSVVSIDD